MRCDRDAFLDSKNSSFWGVGIPALAAEFTLLTIVELYLRPGGTVNNRKNRSRRTYPDKKSLHRV